MAKSSFDLPKLEQRFTEGGLPPRTIVVKVILPDDPSRRFPEIEPLGEILALADTRGLGIVGTLMQRRSRPHVRTYLGKGKVEELKALIEETDAELLLFDHPLSPRQGKTLEDMTRLTIMDRTELIMEIFATHARTRQAQLQVELAQMRYSVRRLKRMWTHLSRFEGGIGMRGPGETQLETDRRLIRRRIVVLEGRLEEIEKQAATQHKGRENTFQVALVGYTNAGKSSLMRRLTGADVEVEDQLFSTLDTCTRRWDLDCARPVILSDTVGFIRDLPHGLVASFHATLMAAHEADLLFHVVDVSTSHVEADMEAVDTTLAAIDCTDRPRMVLFNKIDLLPEERHIDMQYLLEHHPEAVAVSAHDGRGMDLLSERVLEMATAEESVTEYRLPHSRGDLLARLRHVGTILEERYDEDGIVASVRIVPEQARRFGALLARNGIASP